jgi:glyoxylase-like metal-dependent hydrolase (beta-lactamase superfamily II)
VQRIVRVLAPNPGVFELEGTNTWVIGEAPAIVVDPGPDARRHLDEVVRTAGRVGEIVLTHDHPDHAPGATPLAEMSGAPVRAVRPPAGGVRLRDGEIVTSGGASLRVVATPGHSSDHVVLWRGTSVIDPPEGDLAAYLRSLRRMRELEPRTIYPGHGPVVMRAIAKLDEYLEHRAARERQILEALTDGPRSIDELVAEIYADYPTELHELAARSVLAHLLKLASEGRIDDTTKAGVKRYEHTEPRACARCGRRVTVKAKYCGPCSLAILQGTG